MYTSFENDLILSKGKGVCSVEKENVLNFECVVGFWGSRRLPSKAINFIREVRRSERKSFHNFVINLMSDIETIFRKIFITEAQEYYEKVSDQQPHSWNLILNLFCWLSYYDDEVQKILFQAKQTKKMFCAVFSTWKWSSFVLKHKRFCLWLFIFKYWK